MPKATEFKREHVKFWVVKYSKVNKPYDKNWTAAVSIGYDYYGEGDTIEKAYNDLVDQIMKPNFHILSQLCQINSFKEIVHNK